MGMVCIVSPFSCRADDEIVDPVELIRAETEAVSGAVCPDSWSWHMQLNRPNQGLLQEHHLMSPSLNPKI